MFWIQMEWWIGLGWVGLDRIESDWNGIKQGQNLQIFFKKEKVTLITNFPLHLESYPFHVLHDGVCLGLNYFR